MSTERKKQAGQIERAISHASINKGDFFLPVCSTRKYSLEVLQQESLSKYSRKANQQ
jgi:hypothetical protein